MLLEHFKKMQFCHKETTKRKICHMNFKLILVAYGLINIIYKTNNKKNFNN